MRLEQSTWKEIEAYLERSDGVIVPFGSIEQHGPIGLIGTDMLCAQDIGAGAGDVADALVVPAVGYTPAPFNMSFPGTVSVTEGTFRKLAAEIFDGLIHHGFRHIYALNAHGANLAPLKQVLTGRDATFRIRSWWDFPEVNELRDEWYGDWEGMHATPSEIAITQAGYRIVNDPDLPPPEKLSRQYILDHAGDRHGPPDEHRSRFPDGRVGSHSSLASPGQGRQLFDVACHAVAQDYLAFLQS